MSFDKSAYDQQYAKTNLIRKMIPFNRLQAEDLALLAWAESKGNFVGYVKALIAADMKRSGKQGEPTGEPESTGP